MIITLYITDCTIPYNITSQILHCVQDDNNHALLIATFSLFSIIIAEKNLYSIGLSSPLSTLWRGGGGEGYFLAGGEVLFPFASSMACFFCSSTWSMAFCGIYFLTSASYSLEERMFFKSSSVSIS